MTRSTCGSGCLRDSAPDAWGRRVILNPTFGTKGKDADTGVVDELTYLLWGRIFLNPSIFGER